MILIFIKECVFIEFRCCLVDKIHCFKCFLEFLIEMKMKNRAEFCMYPCCNECLDSCLGVIYGLIRSFL